ncbi:hypothetical protein FACS1894160_4490 [Bacteroidia bacterium]|nr:hypothetical protein FACS1894123_05260 [Bacteroidia bacterium]GHV09121.1 hypothetical protein FACS1894160_4490 [Bacteroidia bacterium]
MLNAAGKTLSGTRIDMVQSNNGSAGAASTTAQSGINAINSALERGEPIIVGVDYKAGSGNANGITDHFITIVGRTVQANGTTQYHYFDPATSSQSAGTSSNNVLTLSGGKLTGTFSNNGWNYTVSEVRTNK